MNLPYKQTRKLILTTLVLTVTASVAFNYLPVQRALAQAQAGQPVAWGRNTNGQIGDGTLINKTAPVAVIGLSNVVAIAAGSNHDMALRADGTAWAWGDNSAGQLGNGTTTDSSLPVQVSGLTSVIAVSGGATHSMALKADETVWTWGFNTLGALGDGTTTNSSVPVQVSGLTNVAAIDGGTSFSLALRSDGTVWAWGTNSSGQLGNGTTSNSTVPVQVSGLTDVIAISAGSTHSMAVKADGTAWAWGSNTGGKLGDGTTTSSPVPVQMSGLTDVVAVAAGFSHGVALKTDGTVWGCGVNSAGQIGDGTNIARTTPVQVVGLNDVVTIASGSGNYNLAVKADGAVWAWGQNDAGQLGNGTTVNSNVPVRVIDPSDPTGFLSGINLVAAGQGNSLALRTGVQYNFSGFFQPLDNLPAVNLAQAGGAIPIKFSLNGDQGMNILAPGYPTSQVMTCGGGTSDTIEETLAASQSGLTYDNATDVYVYVWKTERAWKGTCRQVIVKLSDGTMHTANFQFR